VQIISSSARPHPFQRHVVPITSPPRTSFLVIAAVLFLSGASLRAEPPEKKAPALARIVESANGWTYVKGEWIHPEGYKFVNNKVVRTTARTGKSFPNPPGKLAQENPLKLTPRATPAATDNRTAAEKAAEERRKNLTPRPAPQTGSHL
jgi:hypothetical protein